MLRKQPLQGVRHKTRIGKRFSRMLSCEPGLLNKHTKIDANGFSCELSEEPALFTGILHQLNCLYAVASFVVRAGRRLSVGVST